MMILVRLFLCVWLYLCGPLLLSGGSVFSLLPDVSAFYSGRVHDFSIEARGYEGKELDWNLRYSGRTLFSGRRVVPDGGKVKISFEFPRLNPGVVAEAEFSCFVVGDVGGASGKVLTNSAGVVRGGIRRKLYFFHPNPFEGEREMLVESKLGVWDLDGEKRLTGLLESLEVPFAGVAVPEGFAGGVLLVSGLCLERHPGAPEMLFSLAEGGMKVIVVSLHSGRFILPLQGMSCFSIGGAEVISGALGQKGTSLGKDILATVFREYSDTAEPGLELVAFSEAVALGLPGRATGDEVKGFAFCEIRTRESLEGHSGRIIFLGGDIVGRAGMSPAPAYLLNELLRP